MFVMIDQNHQIKLIAGISIVSGPKGLMVPGGLGNCRINDTESESRDKKD